MLVMGSTLSHPYDEALKVRRSSLDFNIKVWQVPVASYCCWAVPEHMRGTRHI